MSDRKGEDDSWVFDSLVNFLHGPIWKLPVLGFVEDKSVVFDPDSYSNMTDEKEEEYRKIHEEYKALVDYMLASFMDDLQVTAEQVEEACQMREQHNQSQPESNITKIALEQLWAAEDFNTFRRLMTRKNIDLQLQSLELLVAKYGVLSPSLRAADSMASDGDNGEEDFLQVVIRYSDQSELFHNAASSTSSTYEPSSSSGQEKSEGTPEYQTVLLHAVPSKHQTFNKNDTSVALSLPQLPYYVSTTTEQIRPSQILEQERQAAGIDISRNESECAKVTTTPPSTPVAEPERKSFATENAQRTMVDEVTVAEIASAAPEQHRILTSVRRAFEVRSDNETPETSPTLEIPLVGTEEEIQRRREYLRSQRDKLVALKKQEREKLLSTPDITGGSAQSKRPKSARAAQMALKIPPIPGTATNEKSLAARRALADRLKQELIEKN